jgi:16S rRNA processing protein RimM
VAGRVCVGAIAGAFGVRGEVRIKSFCAEPEAIFGYPLTTEDGARSFDAERTGQAKNGFTARISGVTTKEQADALRGTRLFADRGALPPLDEDEYYHADLIGLEVVDTGGQLLGRVKAVLNHGATDLLELHRLGESGTVLLPFTREAVPTVDIASGRVVADPPEGLF